LPQAWGVPRRSWTDQPGLTVVEVMHAILAGGVKGMYIMGENPAMSDPDVQHARAALAALDMLVVQDIFLTETACLADVVLPASAFPKRPAASPTPTARCRWAARRWRCPGQARQDLWIITALAQQLGPGLAAYGATPTDCDARRQRGVRRDARLMPSIAGITWSGCRPKAR
jgi:formate dehydrogenase major subunit